MSHMDRKTLLERAGIGAGVLALPALLGAEAALAGSPPNSRIATWIVVNQRTPAVALGVFPAIAWTGEVAFRPEQEFIKGGGHFTIVDWNLPPANRVPPLVTGAWMATDFLGWTTAGVGYPGGLPAVGQIQPGVLDATIEMDGLGEATMKFACNVGFVGLQTGEPETVQLTMADGTMFNTIVASLTSSTIPGYPNVPVTA